MPGNLFVPSINTTQNGTRTAGYGGSILRNDLAYDLLNSPSSVGVFGNLRPRKRRPKTQKGKT